MYFLCYLNEMNMKSILLTLCLITSSIFSVQAQDIQFEGKSFELVNVTASVEDFQNEKVLKVERDLQKMPFDVNRLESTVDEPTFVKLKDLDFENGTIEVKLYSDLQNPSPFAGAAGFIGIAFRIDESNTAYESIYLRPRVGRSDNQAARNRTVQYYAYPYPKFDTLRKTAPGRYEGSAPVALREWITMRIEVNGERAEMFINDARYSTFIVDKMLGKTKHGAIGLWVDIGTIGYFKDLKITRR